MINCAPKAIAVLNATAIPLASAVTTRVTAARAGPFKAALELFTYPTGQFRVDLVIKEAVQLNDAAPDVRAALLPESYRRALASRIILGGNRQHPSTGLAEESAIYTVATPTSS